MRSNLKKLSNEADYFDQLPQVTQDVVKNWLEDTFGGETEELECRSRSGFIPHSWNRGGLHVTTFKSLYDFHIGDPLYTVLLDKGVEKKVQARIDSLLEDAKEAFLEKYAETLSDLGVKNEDVNYHGIEKASFQLAEEFASYELEFLEQYDGARTFHEARVMYDGEGTFTVDIMFEFDDAPYHRGYDQVKTFEIETLDPKKLAAFLKKITKEAAQYYPG
jgi:hypothetical protein